MEQFDDLLNKLLAHDPNVNPGIITDRFVDGLKPKFKAVVLLHHP